MAADGNRDQKMGLGGFPVDSPQDADGLFQEPQKILIIGGGVAGLTTALAIKRIAQTTNLPLRPIIFEAASPETAYRGQGMSAHWILWRWAIDTLLELGLGKRLGRIAAEVKKMRVVDAETNETLVNYPPIDEATGLPETVDPEMGSAANAATTPAMLGCRKVDLVRLLLFALSGQREDLYEGESLQFEPANNNDRLDGQHYEGMEADLVRSETWFQDEGYASLIPDFHLGYELDSFLISASSGKATVKFTNGVVEQGFMLIGADGTHSKVRELLGSNRFPAQHAGAAIVHGITRLFSPPIDMPSELTDGSPIPQSRLEDIKSFCPPHESVGMVSRGVAFGVNHLGNDTLAWNLIIGQTEPHLHTSQFAAEEERRRAAHHHNHDLESNQTSTGTSHVRGGASPSPTPSIGSDGTAVEQLQTYFSQSSINDDGVASPSAPSSPGQNFRPRRGRIETAFERQLRVQREDLLAQKRADVQQSNTSGGVNDLYSNGVAASSNSVTHLSGSDARALALNLASRHPALPTPVYSIIARSDPQFTNAEDVLDLAQEYPESYTSPNFHPGRVVLVGDAAHPVATNANGSVGGGLCLTDSVLLAKLIAKHLGNHQARSSPTTSNGLLFESPHPTGANSASVDMENRFAAMAKEFDTHRVAVCSRIMTDARAEGGWGRTENGWVRSLWRLSWKVTSKNWVRSTFAQMLERGGIPGGYVTVRKPRSGASEGSRPNLQRLQTSGSDKSQPSLFIPQYTTPPRQGGPLLDEVIPATPNSISTMHMPSPAPHNYPANISFNGSHSLSIPPIQNSSFDSTMPISPNSGHEVFGVGLADDDEEEMLSTSQSTDALVEDQMPVSEEVAKPNAVSVTPPLNSPPTQTYSESTATTSLETPAVTLTAAAEPTQSIPLESRMSTLAKAAAEPLPASPLETPMANLDIAAAEPLPSSPADIAPKTLATNLLDKAAAEPLPQSPAP